MTVYIWHIAIAVNTQKTVRKIILLRTVCIFGQFCKLEIVDFFTLIKFNLSLDS